MSKESTAGGVCICGQRIAFQDKHWPHCKKNPDNLSREDRAHMETIFTKAELAHISLMGKPRE